MTNGNLPHLLNQFEDTDMVEALQKNYESIVSELRRSLSWMDLVISNVSEGILVVGGDARILFANDAVAAMLGTPRITLLGKPVWRTLELSADGKFLKKSDYLNALNQNNLELLTGRYKFQSGENVQTVDVTVSAITNMQQAVFVIRDITQRLQNEQALSEERIERVYERARRKKAEEDERLLQDIINGTTAVVFLKDVDGKYVMVNNQFKKVFGLGDTKIKGKTDTNIFSKEIANALHKNDEEVLNTRKTIKWEESILHDDEQHTYLFLKYPLFNSVGKLHRLCGVLTDITARKRLEDRKDDFINMASHELQTPLTSMKIFMELIQKHIEQGEVEKSLDLFSKVSNQLNELSRLAESLLNVSRIESGKLKLEKEEFDLNALVNETIETAQSTTDEHTICLKENLKQQHILGDRHRISQVLLNLLTNAIKYSPEGGDIIVRIKTDATHVTVSVEDEGVGIAQEDQEKIFGRFYRVTSPGGKEFSGLGMGLYIASEIIRRHGGTINAKSEEGKGSTFYFQLPIR